MERKLRLPLNLGATAESHAAENAATVRREALDNSRSRICLDDVIALTVIGGPLSLAEYAPIPYTAAIQRFDDA